jgi:hypothetical protein
MTIDVSACATIIIFAQRGALRARLFPRQITPVRFSARL